MLARYHRNDILDENGEISYLKLAKAAPNCRVHVYEIPRMTENKDDKVDGCTYTMYHGSTNAAIASSNKVVMRVQGTSSAAYGIAAFNVDCDFKKAIANGDFTAEQLTDAVLGNKAIPCTYFTTKVNVASCEGANNALNQEWYNLHQPHKMSLRKKNAAGGWNGTGRLYRDTMQFEPGVLFIVDKNQETNGTVGTKDNVFKDTVGYIANPYPKMYSICNMGNSKKNLEVFHDINNPRECCVEVADNQLPEQRMLHYRDAFKWNDAKYAWTSLGIDGSSDAKVFEFRYPDAKDTYTEGTDAQKAQMNQMRLDWERFFTWMGQCNLQPKSEANPNGYDVNAALPDNVQKSFEAFTVTQNGLLKGTAIDTFAGTYTHDTKEYRIAKMLSECEDYLCLDSVIYHFLMLERHSMIDNVAKNTFWSTEDGLHWNLNKDYDNDTADGIDNNGVLKLTYGIEAGDTDAGGTSYFNAAPTVWFNFAKELLPLQTKMYIELSQDHEDDLGNIIGSAWDDTAYLNKFTEWQNCIPERCWVEDYYRKYFRPAEIYNDSSYLPRLDGGKKTHQRKQYEKYQHTYIDSKFGGSTTTSGNIQLRANAKEGQINIPLEMYADCYLNAAIGSGTGQTAINYRRRVKRGENIDFEFKVAGDLSDATCYFYLPQYYTKIGDLSAFQPKLVSISNAKKLREIVLGDQYENNQDKAIIKISPNAVPLLEKLIAKKIKDLDSTAVSLNLADAVSLRELDLSESAFNSIQLPNGAPLEVVRLHKPTTIIANNLYSLNDFDIADASVLQNIQLDNVDGGSANMSQIIVDKMLQSNATALQAYKLHNIDWEITNANDIIEIQATEVALTTSTYEDGKYYILVDGNYQLANTGFDSNATYYNVVTYSIPLFDYLLRLTENKADVTKPPHEPWLTGEVNISANAYNSNNSLEFYNKYMIQGVNNDTTKRYPNVNLDFEGENAKLYNVNIYYGGEDDKRIWSKKAVSGTEINATFLATGPAGPFDASQVRKDSSIQYDYVFTGKWNAYNAETNELLVSDIDNLTTCGIEVSCDIRFVPQFTAVARKYPVIIYNDDGTTVLQDFSAESAWIEYGTPIKNILSTVIPVSTLDENQLALDEAYVFKGYSVVRGSSSVISDAYTVEGAETLYATYERMNIYEADFSKYFNISLKSSGYTDMADANYNIGSGYIITPKNDYLLSGKILIPSYVNDTPVIEIGDFTQSDWNITHIFLSNQNGNQIRSISNGAFRGLASIKYFDFKNANNLRLIGSEAFRQTGLDINLNSQLGGNNTYQFGDRAFYDITTRLNGKVVQIPASVARMGHQVFMGYGSTLKINFGSSTQSSQLDLSKSLSSADDNFVRVNALEINFYTNKYTAGSDVVGENSTLTVDHFLKATTLNIISGG